ncbi:MAG: P-loop NTPase, partial [Firmicutes bacterium]|nr:P-loop NTPase [Bacillota bacterium]
MTAKQADHLRGWIEAQGGRIREQIRQGGSSGARVLAITSGKGGVGKTTLAVNLALDLVLKGERVILLDADLGLANVNILLGIEPRHTLWDVVEGSRGLADIVEPGPYGLKLVPGASGLAALARLDPPTLDALVSGFRELDRACDWLIADTGAGIAPGVLAFALAADAVLVVTQPEPTALTDAYGLIKALWAEGYTGAVQLVVNRVRNERQGLEVAGRLKELARRALGVEVT